MGMSRFVANALAFANSFGNPGTTDSDPLIEYRQMIEREKRRMADRKEPGGYRGVAIGCGDTGVRIIDMLQRTINAPAEADGCSMIDTVAINASAESLLRYSADLHVLAEDTAAIAAQDVEIRRLLGYLDYCFIIVSTENPANAGLAQAAARIAREQCGSAATIALICDPYSKECRGTEKAGVISEMLAEAADLTIVLDRDAIERYQPGLVSRQEEQATDLLTVEIIDMFFDYCVRSGGIDTYLYEVLSITRASDTGTVYYLEFDESANNPEALQERFRSQAKDIPEKCTGLLAVVYVDENARLPRVCEIVEAFADIVKPEHDNIAWNVRSTNGHQRLMAIATKNSRGR
jgi:cell division GTPase FtsZ